MRLLKTLLLTIGLAVARPVPFKWTMEMGGTDETNLRGVSPELSVEHIEEGTKIIERLHATHESMQEILTAKPKRTGDRPAVKSAREIFEARMAGFTVEDLNAAREELFNTHKEKMSNKRAGNMEGKGDIEAQSHYYYYNNDDNNTVPTIEVYAFRSNLRFMRSFGVQKMTEDVKMQASFSDVDGDLRNWEFHTFEIMPDGKGYVRGTYGMFGYFEGVVVSADSDYRTAYINWFEADEYNGERRTLSGGAALQYIISGHEWHLAEVYGKRWTSNRMPGGGKQNWYEWWNGDRGLKVEYDGRVHPDDVAWLYSFYDVNNMWTGDTNNPAGHMFTALNDRGETTFMPTGVGSPVGGLLGGYAYKYSPKECREFKKKCAENNRLETGHYGTDMLVSFQASSTVINGFWYALSGPFAGDVGTSMYALMNFGWSQLLVGYYCDPTKYTHYGYTPEHYAFYHDDDGLAEGGCYLETYWMQDWQDAARVKKYMSLNRGNVRMLKKVIKAIYA